MEHVKCDCGFEDEYEPDESGMTYYQAIGKCPNCEKDLGTSFRVQFTKQELDDAERQGEPD